MWRRRSGTGPQDGGGHPDLSADAMTAEEHAEIKRLKAELREARVGNEFLKKAAAFSARESG